MLVSIIGIWAILAVGGESVALTVLALAVLIMLSVGATLLVTMLLSKTVLSGERSSFTIEMTGISQGYTELS